MKRLLLLLCILSSCMIGPRCRKPPVAVPAVWDEVETEGLSDREADLACWWQQFEDPLLDRYICCALKNSPDVEIVCQRIREARGLRTVAASPLWPHLDGSFHAFRQHVSDNAVIGGFPTGVGVQTFDNFQADFDATWEIDIFGRNRRRVEAANADVWKAIGEGGDILVTLTAEVARYYVDVRCFQARIAAAEINRASQAEAVEITKARYDAGLDSELPYREAQSLLATTEAFIPFLEGSLYSSMHRLAVLLGLDPNALYGELEEPQPIPLPPLEIPTGTPCALLRRRPDIKAAEWQMVAANALVGAAMADLLPRIDLFALLGLQSTKLSNFADPSSRMWIFGGEILAPLFQGWKLRAQVCIEDARFQIAAAEYQKTVLEALEEVRNAMVNYDFDRERYFALDDGVQTSHRSLLLARDLYLHGLTDFLNVVEAERAVRNIEDEKIVAECDFVTNAIALYKALGGGWTPEQTQAQCRCS